MLEEVGNRGGKKEWGFFTPSENVLGTGGKDG